MSHLPCSLNVTRPRGIWINGGGESVNTAAVQSIPTQRINGMNATAVPLIAGEQKRVKARTDGSRSQRTRTISEVPKTSPACSSGKNETQIIAVYAPPPRASRTARPLQDVSRTQESETAAERGDSVEGSLQEILSDQPLVPLRLIEKFVGTSLRDDIAASARALISLGSDILGPISGS